MSPYELELEPEPPLLKGIGKDKMKKGSDVLDTYYEKLIKVRNAMGK